MKNDLRKIIDKFNISVKRITIKSGARIIDNKIVVKNRKKSDLDRIYKYLKSRAFDYFPEPIAMDSDYEMYPYIDDYDEPREQKAMDLMHLLSLLHNKTTFYREVDINKNKEIYEDVTQRLDCLNNYYNDLITLIEKEVYMSPSSYLIARNINVIFESIYFAKVNIDAWYKKIENNKNERVSYINNNINLDHYIKNDRPYLIGWNDSRVDNPIYDLLSFYENHYLEFDFDDLFHFYESGYSLKEEERLLLFTYMAIPSKIEVLNDEYDMCININKMIDYLYKTSNLIMNYHNRNG